MDAKTYRKNLDVRPSQKELDAQTLAVHIKTTVTGIINAASELGLSEFAVVTSEHNTIYAERKMGRDGVGTVYISCYGDWRALHDALVEKHYDVEIMAYCWILCDMGLWVTVPVVIND